MKNIRQQRADERDKTAQIFTWCMVVAMHQEEGIGATRLERACNEMHEFQQRYKTKILTENRKSATDAMREDLKGICDFEIRLPQTKAPRNRREEQIRMAQNEGAEIAWLVMAATTHLTFGFGKERLARLKRETLDNYRQYIGWVEQDGEAYAMERFAAVRSRLCRKNSKSTICGKARIISCPVASQRPRVRICCGRWRPYRLRWRQSGASSVCRWRF